MWRKDYWSDITNFVDVCFSCTGQNVIEVDNKGYDPKGNYLICGDCESEDVGCVPPEEVIEH